MSSPFPKDADEGGGMAVRKKKRAAANTGETFYDFMLGSPEQERKTAMNIYDFGRNAVECMILSLQQHRRCLYEEVQSCREQRERDDALSTTQINIMATLINALQKLTAQVAQYAAASTQPDILHPGLNGHTAQLANPKTDPEQQCAASQTQPVDTQSQATALREGGAAHAHNAKIAQPSQALSAMDSPCDIPNPPVAKGISSLESVWQQYMSGTVSRPSIRQLYAGHGHDWQKKQLGYNKVEFGRKRKLICAIEALQQLKQASPATALSIVRGKVEANGGQLVRFADSLPSLDAHIHPCGRQAIVAGAASVPQGLSNQQKEDYEKYLQAVKEKLKLLEEPVV